MNISQLKNQLYKLAKEYLDDERTILVDRAIDISQDKLEGLKNRFNKTFFEESIEVAIITTSVIGLGISAILSVLLFRAYEIGKINKEDIQKYFPDNFSHQIIIILNGLKESNKLDNESVFGLKESIFNSKYQDLSKREKKFAKNINSYLSEQGEYFKNFYIVVSKDVRVVLLKLAFHYYKLQNIEKYSNQKRLLICREARFLYAPIAHQLGLYNIKTFLEEMAMKYLNSEDYRSIAQKLTETKHKREKYISDFLRPIKKIIYELDYQSIVKGRSKSIHSIWKKFNKQDVGLDEIFDLFAIRIILSDNFEDNKAEKLACWNVYSKITNIWTPNPKRLRDWISTPKTSGYESLHITVLSSEKKWVEVQIRTKRMDDIAEQGSAAHWRYKEVKGQKGHSKWLDKLQSILEVPKKADEIIQNQKKISLKNISEVKDTENDDFVIVFTPKGEARKFIRGATVLDFAYKIHSKIGNHCTGAKIENKLVGIRHKLVSGNVIEIQTSNTQIPKVEWVDIVASQHAKTRIKRSLKEAEKEQIEHGKLILFNVVAKFRSKYNKADFDFDDKKVNILRKKFGVKRIADFYLQILSQKIIINVQLLYDVFVAPEELSYQNAIDKLISKVEKSKKEQSDSKDLLVIDKDAIRIKYEFAKCCNPIPGDKIFAFVTVEKGTKIHKKNCPNAKQLHNRYPYRVMNAVWKSTVVDAKFKTKLKIISVPKPGIVTQISDIISKQAFVDLYEINIENSQKETFEGIIGVLVGGTKYLDELIRKIKEISGMIAVQRIDG